MSDLLRSLGIPVLEPYAESNLDPAPDLVVIGNALSRGNPEIERVLDERIPFTSMAALLREEFLKGRESLVVAGTHGKTTTTSMLAWIYQVAARTNPSLEPSFLIGGVAENFGTSFQLRPTRTFILEGDEYDTAFFDKGPKFLHYFPDALILTHVEFDHADIYADLEAVKTAFKRLVNLVPRRGLIVAYDGSPNVTECVEPRLLSRRALRIQRGRRLAHPQSPLRIRPHALGSSSHPAPPGPISRCTSPASTTPSTPQPPRRACRRPGHPDCRHRRSPRHLQKRQAPPRSPCRNQRHHAHRRLRPSPHGHPRNPPGAALHLPFARASGQSSSRAPTRCAAKFSRPISLRACGFADRVVLAAVYQQERIPEAERLHPEEVVRALNDAGTPGRASRRR